MAPPSAFDRRNPGLVRELWEPIPAKDWSAAADLLIYPRVGSVRLLLT